VRSFLINPPVPSKRAKPQPKNDVDATAHWAVTPTPMELSEREMARRRLIADRRRGEDVKAARRTGNTDEVARLIAARELRRRKKRRLSRLQALKQAS
jgi:hypothetical protein